MTKKLYLYLPLILLFSFTFSACQKNNLLGGDKDEHGCIGSAGYTWCQEKEKCLRTWEEDCSQVPQDPAQDILDSSLKLFDGDKVTLSKDQKLKWNLDKGVDSKEYPANAITISDLSPDQKNLLSRHLLDSGFSIDPNNVSAGTVSSSTGYQKGNLVCQLVEGYQGEESDINKGLGKLYLKLLCAEI